LGDREKKSAYFREEGSGSTVVCVHSSASSSGQWRSLMDALSDRYRVVAMDLYGYGKSPAWPGARELLLDDEVALMAPILKNAGKFHLIGHSYGGLIALKLALDDPARIASLTLYEPTCFFLLFVNDSNDQAGREILAIRDETNHLVDIGDLDLAAERFFDYWMGPGAWSKTPEASRSSIVKRMKKVRSEWTTAFDKPLPSARISALPMSVLLLTGARSTAAARGVVRLLHGLLPQAKVVELPGLGHMGPVTHPEKVNPAIVAFLDHMK
jgi:pimeloyl-ACP methyl ester carboxylesterase